MHFCWNGQTYEYTIVRKRIKNIILHVKPDGTVYVSAPPAASEQTIQRFVTENAARLADMTEQAKQRKQPQMPDYTDGAELPHLGGTIRLRYAAAPCRTTLENGVLTVFAGDAQEAQLAHRRWLIDECLALYRDINREVHDAYTKAGYSVPLARIEIKEMKSRWGSCTAKTGRISINFRLMQYPPGCVYAVFYHEYAHFMQQNHSAAFYSVLRGVFPEYDRWDAVLNQKGKEL